MKPKEGRSEEYIGRRDIGQEGMKLYACSDSEEGKDANIIETAIA